MNNKTRSFLRIAAILLVLLAVLMVTQTVLIPALAPYSFWMVVIAFALVLLVSR